MSTTGSLFDAIAAGGMDQVTSLADASPALLDERDAQGATPILMAVLFNRLGLGVLKSVAGGLAASLSVAGVFQGLLNVVLPVGMFDVTIFG